MSKHGSNIRDFFGPSSRQPKPKAATHPPPPSLQSIPFSNPVTINTTPKLDPGKLEVENSEDDDGDSDSSLESLSDIIRARRGNVAATTTAIPRAPSPPVYRKPVVPNSPVKKKYKFDIKSLVHEAAKDDATEVSAKRIQALHDNEDQNGRAGSHDGQEIGATAKVIDAALEDREDGGAQKVMQALKRTEATHIQQRWYFFDTASPSKATRKRFPAKSVKKETWEYDLVDPISRQQTVESGIAKDMVDLGEVLPDEVVLWILDEIPLMSRDALRYAYCDLLDALPTVQIQRILQPELVQKLFISIGATKEGACLLKEHIATRPPLLDPYPDHGWDAAISIISLLGRLGQHSPIFGGQHLISLMARMCLDSVVMADLDLLAACQVAISSLVKCIPDSEWEDALAVICTTISYYTNSNPLRVQMLRCIPAHSPRLQEFRRRCALSFFLENQKIMEHPSDSSFSLPLVTARLHGPEFSITESTDYLNLSALMSLLDIAVDAGQSRSVDLQDEEAEKKFNEDVDILSTRIKVIWSSINDTGASFISRIEAKEVMEGVRYRLMFSVRTKEKPKKSVFDRKKDDEDFTSEKKGMKGFLDIMEKRKGKNIAPAVEIKVK